LGTFTELMEQIIENGLAEENTRHKKQATRLLSSAQTREAVETLAAASVLCSIPRIAIDAGHRGEDEALNARLLLPELHEEEIAAVLDRSVFDIGTMGHVGFHHRDVKNFLAAQWMRKLTKDRDCGHELRDLLFREVHGQLVSVPTRQVAMAWLAPYVPEIMRAGINHAPEMLVDLGDPARLKESECQQLLERYALKYDQLDHSGLWFDHTGLRRFARPSLEPIINKMLHGKDGVSHACKRLLLEIVRAGALDGCRDEVFAIARQCEHSLAIDGLLALWEVGSLEQFADLASTYKTAPDRKYIQYYGLILRILYPKVLSADELVGRIEEFQYECASEFCVPQSIHDAILDIIANETNYERLGILAQAMINVSLCVPDQPNSSREDDFTFSQAIFDFAVACAGRWLELCGEYPEWLLNSLAILQLSKYPRDHSVNRHRNQTRRRRRKLTHLLGGAVRDGSSGGRGGNGGRP